MIGTNEITRNIDIIRTIAKEMKIIIEGIKDRKKTFLRKTTVVEIINMNEKID